MSLKGHWGCIWKEISLSFYSQIFVRTLAWKKTFPGAMPFMPLSTFTLVTFTAGCWDPQPGGKAPHWPHAACHGRQWATDIHHVPMQWQNGSSPDSLCLGPRQRDQEEAAYSKRWASQEFSSPWQLGDLFVKENPNSISGIVAGKVWRYRGTKASSENPDMLLTLQYPFCYLMMPENGMWGSLGRDSRQDTQRKGKDTERPNSGLFTFPVCN